MTNKGPRIKLFKIEKLMLIIIVLLIILIPVINVYLKARVSETNIELEKVKYNIEKQTRLNESLSMKISELTSYDKIQEIADKYNLEYNNDNIKIIEGE